MIVTIDGPAGAGKSSAARRLAERLGFQYLDTGAMYRAVTLAALRRGADGADRGAVRELLTTIEIDLPPGRVLLNGDDVTAAVRRPEVTDASGPIADNPDVRSFLVGMQRRIAAGRDMVCEGRDQGTVVFPDAACKFFLTADDRERARRRYEELIARGESVTLEGVLRAQQERDRRDAARDVGPMVPAADAIVVDSTEMTLEQVVAWMEREVRRCGDR